MSPIRSMTGFARRSSSAGEHVAFVLTIKSVNHRFLDLHVRVPAGCEEFEARVRRLVKEAVRRGHVEVTLTLERSTEAGLHLNQALLAEHLRLFREAAQMHGLNGDPDLQALMRLPGVLSTETSSRALDEATLARVVGPVLEEALAAFNLARAEEGAALGEELRRSMEKILQFAGELSLLREGVRAAQFERVRLRTTELLAGGTVPGDRILAEAAMLAERSDVEEELVRLRTHAERFLAILDGGGETGKRADFLLQELNREANTLLSKTGAATGDSGLRVTEIGLEIKAEIERAREQVQNLE